MGAPGEHWPVAHRGHRGLRHLHLRVAVHRSVPLVARRGLRPRLVSGEPAESSGRSEGRPGQRHHRDRFCRPSSARHHGGRLRAAGLLPGRRAPGGRPDYTAPDRLSPAGLRLQLAHPAGASTHQAALLLEEHGLGHRLHAHRLRLSPGHGRLGPGRGRAAAWDHLRHHPLHGRLLLPLRVELRGHLRPSGCRGRRPGRGPVLCSGPR